MQTFDDETLRTALTELDGWEQDGDRIVREWSFDVFADAVGFIDRVLELADEAGHHPDLFNSFTTVRISLTTHSEGGITEKDLALARRIDAVGT